MWRFDSDVRAVAIAPSGRRVAIACASGVLHVEDAQPERAHPPRKRLVRGVPSAAAWSMDDRWLAVGTDRGVEIFDEQHGGRSHRWREGRCLALRFARDGALLIVDARGVEALDLASGDIQRLLDTPHPVFGFSCHGDRAVTIHEETEWAEPDWDAHGEVAAPPRELGRRFVLEAHPLPRAAEPSQRLDAEEATRASSFRSTRWRARPSSARAARSRTTALSPSARVGRRRCAWTCRRGDARVPGPSIGAGPRATAHRASRRRTHASGRSAGRASASPRARSRRHRRRPRRRRRLPSWPAPDVAGSGATRRWTRAARSACPAPSATRAACGRSRTASEEPRRIGGRESHVRRVRGHRGAPADSRPRLQAVPRPGRVAGRAARGLGLAGRAGVRPRRPALPLRPHAPLRVLRRHGPDRMSPRARGPSQGAPRNAESAGPSPALSSHHAA